MIGSWGWNGRIGVEVRGTEKVNPSGNCYKIKIDFLLNLSQKVVLGDSLLEVNLMIEKLRLKPRLITHHGKTLLFVVFTMLIYQTNHFCKDYLGNSP